MKLVIIVPAYNAAKHLPEMIGCLHRTLPADGHRTVIVDDASRDDTAAVAHQLACEHREIEVVRHPQNGGYGAAMKTGLSRARALGADHAASVHADGQYRPEVLPRLLATLAGHHLDLLQGSRIAGGMARSGGMPRYKIAGNWVLGQFERRTFGLPMTDFHSGYLVYGPRTLAAVPFSRLSDSFDFDLEVIACARARGLLIGEAPIPTRYGDEISHLHPLTYGLRVLRVLWRFKRGHYAM